MFKWISASIEWIKSFFGKKESKVPTVNSSATDNKISITKGSATSNEIFSAGNLMGSPPPRQMGLSDSKQNKQPRRSKMKKKNKNVKRKINN